MRFKKLGALILGALLTIGVAAGIGATVEKDRVKAEETTTVTLTSFTELSANLDDVASYKTAKGGGTSNPAVNSNQIRLYQNSNGTGGGTITISVKENYSLTSVIIGSSMGTKIAHTIGTNTTKSATSNLAANGKHTVNSINNGSITFYCMGDSSSTRLYVNYLSVTYVSSEGGSTDPSEPTEPTPDQPEGDVVDTLDRTLTGMTGTSYSNWSGKTSNSTAVYAGNSAGGNNSIQLRSSNSNSGIITTASGGKVKSIEVEWNSNTDSGRTLNVYGKDTPYTSAADLYNSDNQGEKLGTIVNGKSTSLVIDGDYKYIGLRSSSGAMYLMSIKITWQPQQEVVIPPTSLALDKTNASVALGNNLTLTPTFIPNVSDSQRTITWTADPSDKGVSVENGVVSVANDATIGAVVTIKAQSVVETVFATCIVTVAKEELVSLDHTGFNYFYEGQIISESDGTLTVKYSNDTEKQIDIATDENLTIKLGDVEIESSYPLKLEDSGKKLIFTYKDGEKTADRGIEDINVTKYFAIGNLLTSFASGKEYIDSSITRENKIKFSYSCWADTANLAMEVTVNGSPVLESIGEQVINKNTTNTSNGHVSLTPKTGANGQVEITIMLSVTGQDPVSSSITILVRNDAPTYSGGSSWDKLTDVNQVSDGTYVIAANVDNVYYAMDPTSTTSSKINSSVIAVENEKIAAEDAEKFKVTFTKSQDKFSISRFYDSTTSYLKYTSSTNVIFDVVEYDWSVIKGTNGTFRLCSETDGRGLLYRTGNYNQFGGYSTSNATLTSKEYYDIELFKLTQTDGSWDDTTVVQNFVKDYMHHDEFASFNEGNGGCLGNEGYYAKALAQITDGKMTAAQLLILRDTFKLSYERLQAWAVANGGTFNINDAGEIVTTSAGLNGVLINNDQYTIIIALVAIVALSGFAFFYVTKRKNKELEF